MGAAAALWPVEGRSGPPRYLWQQQQQRRRRRRRRTVRWRDTIDSGEPRVPNTSSAAGYVRPCEGRLVLVNSGQPLPHTDALAAADVNMESAVKGMWSRWQELEGK